MIPSPIGLLAQLVWDAMSKRYPQLRSEVFQLMPDHIHILFYWENKDPQCGGVIDLIGNYKSLVYYYTRKCLGILSMPSFWQRSFHDKIVWSERAHSIITQYILDNPMNFPQ